MIEQPVRTYAGSVDTIQDSAEKAVAPEPSKNRRARHTPARLMDIAPIPIITAQRQRTERHGRIGDVHISIGYVYWDVGHRQPALLHKLSTRHLESSARRSVH